MKNNKPSNCFSWWNGEDRDRMDGQSIFEDLIDWLIDWSVYFEYENQNNEKGK